MTSSAFIILAIAVLFALARLAFPTVFKAFRSGAGVDTNSHVVNADMGRWGEGHNTISRIPKPPRKGEHRRR